MARTFEPLARRLCKALNDLTAGHEEWVPITQAAKLINVSDESLIQGAIDHGVHVGWLSVGGTPAHSLFLSQAGRRAATRKK